LLDAKRRHDLPCWLGAHQFIEGNWEVANAFARGVEDGVPNRCGGAGDPDFSNTTGAEGIELRVGNVQHGYIQHADVGIDRYVIFRKIVIHVAAVGVVEVGLFVKGKAHSPNDATLQLIDAGGVMSVPMS